MIVIAPVLGVIVLSYLLIPLFLKAQIRIKRNKYEFAFQEEPKENKTRGLKALIFPLFMGINISMVLARNSIVINLLAIDPDGVATSANLFLFLLPFGLGISMALFTPAWTILDSGIAYVNKNFRNNHDVEARRAGGWYMAILKGYAGISITYSYILFMIADTIEMFKYSAGAWEFILYFFGPIMFLFALYPSIILVNITQKHRMNFIKKIAQKSGITQKLKLIIELE